MDYPGEYFPARSRARAAFAAWAAAYPADAAKEKAADEEYAAAEKKRKAADFKNSFIGKDLD